MTTAPLEAHPARLVLVGEMNPYGVDPRHALFCAPAGSAGERLQDLVLGVRRATYLDERVVRYNLCVGLWNGHAAKRRAQEIRDLHPADVLVLLGRKVAQAFGCRGWPLFGRGLLLRTGAKELAWRAASTSREFRAILLPHPSGRCREYNDPENVARARDLVRKAAPWFPVGELAAEGG